MKLKVCGINSAENLQQVAKLKPDYIGFIFYRNSQRYVGNRITTSDLDTVPEDIKRVGVFVNEALDIIQEKIKEFKLDYVQLHGNESSKYCARLFLERIRIIKAFSITEDFNFRNLDAYTPFCSYFLFDTKGELPGGNGIKFNWEILKRYDLRLPFFISGGIGSKDAELLKKLSFTTTFGVDINSQFEIKPGTKDIQKIKVFKQQIESIKTLIYEN